MAKIRNKLYKRYPGQEEYIYETIYDSDTIDMIGAPPDPSLDHLNVILKNSEVVSSTLFGLAKDLLFNDITLFNRLDVTSEAFSEGVFDTPRSTLTEDEEIELVALMVDRDAGWLYPDGQPYSEAEEEIAQNRLDYLIQRKYWCTFLLKSEVLDPRPDPPYANKSHKIAVGPGKFKVYEEDIRSDGVYFVENENPGSIINPIGDPAAGVFYTNEIENAGFFRRDLITVVFREPNSGSPYLKYSYGEESDKITPKHTREAGELTESYGTYPLWSLLYERVGGVTYLRRVDRIFDFAGLQSLVRFDTMIPYDRIDGSVSLHSHKDLALRNSNGELLNVMYGESQNADLDSVEGPETILAHADTFLQTVPRDLDSINDTEANKTIFPFILDELYNEYITYQTVQFRGLELGVDISYVGPEGIETNFFTAKKYATADKLSIFSVLGSGLEGTDSYITINTLFTALTSMSYDGTTWENNMPIPIAGDVIIISSGLGTGQLGTIKSLSLVGDNTKIVLDGEISSLPDTDSKIIIFNTASEIRAGFNITQTFLDGLDLAERTAYEYAYKHSTHTGMSRLPYIDVTWDDNPLSNQITRAIGDDDYKLYLGEANESARVIFPLKLNLKLNQWYFVKVCVARKEVAQPTYGNISKMIVATNDHPLEDNHPYYTSAYHKNPGLYPGIDQDDNIFFMIHDKVITVGTDFVWANIEDLGTEAAPTYYADKRIEVEIIPDSGIFLPPYWKTEARNLDPALPLLYRTPPERELNPDYPAFSNKVYLDTVPGIVYVDTFAGKVMFNPNDIPNHGNLSITFYARNNVNGQLDTESIIHIVDPELEETRKNVTLRSILTDLQYQIENKEAEILQVLNYRGLNAKLYEVLGDDRCGQVILKPSPIEFNLFCKREGDMYTVQDRGLQEQQYSVARKFDKRVDGLNSAELPAVKTLTDKISFVYEDQLNTIFNGFTSYFPDVPNHVRTGFKVHTKGTDYAEINIEMLDSTNAVISSGFIAYADIPAAGEWFYIDLDTPLVIGSTYSYILWAAGATIAPRINAAVINDFETADFKAYYQPPTGQYYTGQGPDIMRMVYNDTSTSFEVMTPLVDVRDVLDNIGGSDENTLDYFVVDFSEDAFFLNWEYEDYIGIDIFRGRIKMPPGYDIYGNVSPNPTVIKDFFIEFNGNFPHNELNTKTVKRHGQANNNQHSLEDAFNFKYLNDTPGSYLFQANKIVKVKDDETGLDFMENPQFIIEDAQRKISNLQSEVDDLNRTTLDLTREIDILSGRQSTDSDIISEFYRTQQQINRDATRLLNVPAQIMTNNEWNDNWDYVEEDKFKYLQGKIRNPNFNYMMEKIDLYDLEGIGQSNKGAIEYDAINQCYWMISNAGTNNIGEITKLLPAMEDGQIVVVARWYIVAGGASTGYAGITSDGSHLYIILSGTTNNNKIAKLSINLDGTLGKLSTANGSTFTPFDSTHFEYVTAIATNIVNDICLWGNNIATLESVSASVWHIVPRLKSDGSIIGGATPAITNLNNYIGGTTTSQRAITRFGDDIYIKMNDHTTLKRCIYYFNYATDYASPASVHQFIKCSGRFEIVREIAGTVDYTAAGITIGPDGDLYEITSTASNGKFLAKRSLAFPKTVWAENQVSGEYPCNAATNPVTPHAMMVEDDRYYWTADNDVAANLVDIYRFDTVTGEYKHARIIGITWTRLRDLTYNPDTGILYILGALATTGNNSVYMGSLSDFVSLMADVYNEAQTITPGTTWGDVTACVVAKNLYGMCHGNDLIYILNDSDDKIDTLSLDGTVYTPGVYFLPAAVTNWVGLAFKNDKLYLANHDVGTNPKFIYALPVDKQSSTAWYRSHIYQDPSPLFPANTIKCFDFHGNDLVATSFININFIKMKVLEDPSVMQLQTFIDANNILLTNNTACLTEIVTRYVNPEDFEDSRDCPHKNYMAVGYVDEGFTLLHLDLFLGQTSNTGQPRYNVENIIFQHFKRGADNIVTAAFVTNTIFIEKEMIVVTNSAAGTYSLFIDLRSGKVMSLYNTTGAGAYYQGSLSERNDAKTWAGAYNPELITSGAALHGTNARTFFKEDDSDYNNLYPTTYFSIGGTAGCDILIVSWDENNNRIPTKVWKNVFNIATMGRYGNWIAPSGRYFGYNYDIGAQLCEVAEGANITTKQTFKIWEINRHTIGYKAVAPIASLPGITISNNSRCWKTTNGRWRHQLIINPGIVIVDIENYVSENPILSLINESSAPDISEDLIFFTYQSFSSSGYFGGLKVIKKLKFNTKSGIYNAAEVIQMSNQNNWETMIDTQWRRRPYFMPTARWVNGDGVNYLNKSPKYSKDFGICAVSTGNLGGMQFIHLNMQQDEGEVISKEFEIDNTRKYYLKKTVKK